MTFKIKTNNAPRDLIYGYELTEKERKEFDYISSEDLSSHQFFRYKGNVYDPSDFMRAREIGELADWDGYASDSFFSGIVIKYADDQYETIIVGFYTS